ncbi:MAG: class I SAM-dependent methyltransferase [Acidobacteriota bacterium]
MSSATYVNERGLEQPDLESSSDRYALRFSGRVGRYLLERQEQLTLELCEPWKGGTVLDIGGGHGQLVGPLAREGYRVTVLGTDPSCQQRPRHEVGREGYRALTGDLLDPPLRDKSVDVVLAFRIMAHVTSWQRLLAAAARVARHAVIVDFATTDSLNSIAPMLFKLKKGFEGDTRQYGMMSRAEVGDELTSLGLPLLASRPQFFWPMALHRMGKLPFLSRGLEAPASWLGLTSRLGSPVILRAAREGSLPSS